MPDRSPLPCPGERSIDGVTLSRTRSGTLAVRGLAGGAAALGGVEQALLCEPRT